ncbi:MAG: hypothetical protein Q8P57_04535 [Candidatus Pacearchaeota archaeon]|nr:hypothetical protein [Candidatus Pacearchaeota archaeon]
MIIIKKEMPLKIDNRIIRQRDEAIAVQKNKLPVVQIVTETRVRRDNASIYENTRSREIKKWFEARRI